MEKPEIQTDPQGLMARAERILVGSQSNESVLGQRFGPTPDCFSIRDIVNLFQWGATTDDMRHLSKCPSCSDWVANYAKRPSRAFAQTTAEPSEKASFPHIFGGVQKPALQAQPALLHVCNQALTLEDLTRPQDFVIVAGISDQLDADSLRLDGALIAERGTIVKQVVADAAYSAIRFDHVRVADVTQKDLKNHVALTDSICIHGRLGDSSKEPFCGKAHVRLVRDPEYKVVGD